MTSTGINQGLGDEQKPTSRVLRPPGGGASNIFGGEADPPPKRQSQRAHVSQQPSQGQTKKLFGESDHVEKILPQTRGSDSKNRIFGDAVECVNVDKVVTRTPPNNTHSNIFGEDNTPSAKQKPQETSDNIQPLDIIDTVQVREQQVNRLRRGFYNPITGEAYEKTACSAPPPKPKPVDNYQPLPSAGDGPGVMQSTSGKAQDVRTSSRVLNPPGGPTTKLW